MEKNKTSDIEIPQELIDKLQSEETATEIARICAKNEINGEEQVKEISYQIGLVLVGNLLPQELAKTLEKKAKISSFLAQKIYREINESIFYPVNESLVTLYGDEAILPKKPTVGSIKIIKEKTKEIKRGEDTYREPVE